MGVIVSRHVGTKKDLRSYLKSLERMTNLRYVMSQILNRGTSRESIGFI